MSYQPDIAANLGALIRLAACFDVPLEVIEPCGFPLSIKALRRAAMDYADIANLSKHASWDDFLLSHPNDRKILLTTKAAASLWDFKFEANDALILGRESAGVPKDVAMACDHRIKIPINPLTRSLNVTTAGAIALGEMKRQTRG